jgi:hypothetical protein
MSKRQGHVPGTYSARQRRYGVHFNELAARKGWPLKPDERIVAALADEHLSKERRRAV